MPIFWEQVCIYIVKRYALMFSHNISLKVENSLKEFSTFSDVLCEDTKPLLCTWSTMIQTWCVLLYLPITWPCGFSASRKKMFAWVFLLFSSFPYMWFYHEFVIISSPSIVLFPIDSLIPHGISLCLVMSGCWGQWELSGYLHTFGGCQNDSLLEQAWEFSRFFLISRWGGVVVDSYSDKVYSTQIDTAIISGLHKFLRYTKTVALYSWYIQNIGRFK